MRTPFLSLLGAVLAGCGSDWGRIPGPPPPIVVISIDTLRRDRVGFHGYERDTTPALDRLASESLVFERAYTTASWTLIAHMSLLTGMQPEQHGVHGTARALFDEIPTLSERLDELGYWSMGFYKPGWLDPRFGYERGFDVYEAHESVEEAGEHVAAALASRPAERPFFLFVHLFDVHNGPLARGAPYAVGEPWDSMFVPDARARLEGFDAPRAFLEDASFVTPAQHEAIVALYDGGVRKVDDHLGQWFDAWRAEGWFDDALIVVTSDHGESLLDHGDAYGGHGGQYEEALRVPLVMRMPGAAEAGRVDGLRSQVDLVPTLIRGLELEPDERLTGVSLLAPADPERLIWAQRPDTGLEVLLRGNWKVLSWPEEPRKLRGYDLQRDPDEREAVRAKDAARWAEVEALRRDADAASASWYRPAGKQPRARKARAEDADALRALGYSFDEDD